MRDLKEGKSVYKLLDTPFQYTRVGKIDLLREPAHAQIEIKLESARFHEYGWVAKLEIRDL